MAMGAQGQEKARRALSACRPFESSTRSFRGTWGSTDKMGWLRQHPERDRIKNLLLHATYVVWSYDTPIGFVTEDETGNITKYYIDEQHTVTTSHHQTILRVAWGEYETIGDGPARRVRVSRTPRREPTAAHVYAVTARRERDDVYLTDDAMSLQYRSQDDLMDEVHGYVHPAHP